MKAPSEMIEWLAGDRGMGAAVRRRSRLLMSALAACFVAKVVLLASGSPPGTVDLSRTLSLFLILLPVLLLRFAVPPGRTTKAKRGFLVALLCVPPLVAFGEGGVLMTRRSQSLSTEAAATHPRDDWEHLRLAALGGNPDAASVAGLEGTRRFEIDAEMEVTLERGPPGRATVEGEIEPEQRDLLERHLASPVPFGLAEGEWWFKVEDRSSDGLPELPVRRSRLGAWIRGSTSPTDLAARVRDHARVLRGMASPAEGARRVHEDPGGDYLLGWGLLPEDLVLDEESHLVRWRGLKATSRARRWGLRPGDLISGMGPLESLGAGRGGLAVGGATLRGLCGCADRSAGAEGLAIRVWRGKELIRLTPEPVPVRVDDHPEER